MWCKVSWFEIPVKDVREREDEDEWETGVVDRLGMVLQPWKVSRDSVIWA